MADLTINPGDIPTAAQFNSYMTHTGGAWNTWSPTITQSGSVTFSGGYSAYHRSGRLITFIAVCNITGTGTGSNDIVITLPVTASSSLTAATTMVGRGRVYDNSAGATYSGDLFLATTTTVKIADPAASGTISRWLGSAGSLFNVGLANTDVVSMQGFYEAAAG